MEDNKEELIAQYLGGESEYEEPTYEEIPIPLNFEGILNEDTEGLVAYDVEKFRKGVKDFSYVAGAFSALRNSGMSEEATMQWLLSQEELKGLSKQLEAQERVTQIKADACLKEEV